MAKLFISYGGKKFEQRFSRGVPQFVDQRGNVATGPTAKALQEPRVQGSRAPLWI
jgi:hypothetical protein